MNKTEKGRHAERNVNLTRTDATVEARRPGERSTRGFRALKGIGFNLGGPGGPNSKGCLPEEKSSFFFSRQTRVRKAGSKKSVSHSMRLRGTET